MRLCKTHDFTRIFRYGHRFRQGVLLVLALRNDLQYPRLGVVVPKRQVRLAHDRNRFKRIIRDHFRLHQSLIGGRDIVVLVRSSGNKPSADVLRATLVSQWRRLATKVTDSI